MLLALTAEHDSFLAQISRAASEYSCLVLDLFSALEESKVLKSDQQIYNAQACIQKMLSEERTFAAFNIMAAPVQHSHFPIMEHFSTIQGEGFYSGTPAYFIRIGGCNVGCHWCDVKESWPDQGHDSMPIEELVQLVEKSGLSVVVITGGEPMMYNLDGLTAALQNAGKSIHLETSGAYPLSGSWSWITFSPKKLKTPKAEFYNKAQELKVVIFNQSDFAFAEQHAAEVHEGCKLYLQPEWSKRDAMMPLIVEYIKKHPKWRVSLQTHKYMHIP